MASTLRYALRSFSRDQLLEHARSEKSRERLRRLTERAKSYEHGVHWVEVAAQMATVAILLPEVFDDGNPRVSEVALWVAWTAPTFVLIWRILPWAFAKSWGYHILGSGLVPLAILLTPIMWIVVASEWVQGAVYRAISRPNQAQRDGQVLQGLRSVLKDQGQNDDLDETAQELITNVLDFRGADAAEVMTPRTEVEAIDVQEGLDGAMQAVLESGHSRIPVFEDTIDSIIGTVTARRLIREMSKPEGERCALNELLDPPMLVPETKPVAELLREFRAVKQKLAVVLDEYGGTAGIVTLSDVVGEIVGDFVEEHEQHEQRIREVDRHVWEVAASLHVSEVNEALSLEIPEEEDFETLGGFVLARLGRIPARGESFEWGSTQYAVQEASDRRIIWVRVRTSA